MAEEHGIEFRCLRGGGGRWRIGADSRLRESERGSAWASARSLVLLLGPRPQYEPRFWPSL